MTKYSQVYLFLMGGFSFFWVIGIYSIIINWANRDKVFWQMQIIMWVPLIAMIYHGWVYRNSLDKEDLKEEKGK